VSTLLEALCRRNNSCADGCLVYSPPEPRCVVSAEKAQRRKLILRPALLLPPSPTHRPPFNGHGRFPDPVFPSVSSSTCSGTEPLGISCTGLSGPDIFPVTQRTVPNIVKVNWQVKHKRNYFTKHTRASREGHTQGGVKGFIPPSPTKKMSRSVTQRGRTATATSSQAPK